MKAIAGASRKITRSAGVCSPGFSLPPNPSGFHGVAEQATARTTNKAGRAGYAVLGFMLVLFGLVIVGIVFAPNLVLKLVVEKNRDSEEQRIKRLGSAFDQSVQRGQAIPSHTNWITALTPFASMDQTEVEQVSPSYGADPNLMRVFLIDPNLSLLPYVQSPAGLTGSQTNLLGSAARVMIISNTKRNLTLPVTSGLAASSGAFNAIWDWVFDPATQNPPSSWPGSWSGNGHFLHVHSINLANLFHRVTCRNLLYGMSTNTMTNIVTTQTAFHFLRGTPLALGTIDGKLKRLHVVNRDISFDFTPDAAILEQNTSGGKKAHLKKDQKGAQSFRHGAAGEPDYFISKLVLHFSRDADAPNANLNVNIGTARNSGPLAGSSISISPSEITDTSSGASFMTYEINYSTPVGPLTAGTTYYINLECGSSNGMAFYVELSSSDTYSNGTYDDGNRDAWFQIWGQ